MGMGMGIFIFILTLFLGGVCVVAESEAKASFDFPSFSLNNNITLLGDSSLMNNGVLCLTGAAPTYSTGAVVYNHPISLFDPQTSTLASFSATFSFSISTLNPASSGDGLAFFLSPHNLSLLLSGPLGLPAAFVAVVFDTRLDYPFHVAFDINTIKPLKTGDPILHGIDLKSGNTIASWIDYNTEKTSLNVFLSYSMSKPLHPVLSVHVDLSQHLKDPVYVGFSASTQGITELHQIHSWSFLRSAFLPPRTRLHPHNVSVVGMRAVPASSSPKKRRHHHKRVAFLTGSVSVFAAFMLLGYVFVRRWRGRRRKEKGFVGENFVACPRAFDYKELKSATREFHPSRIVGHGSFGTVYKAFFMSSGTIAAVKRSRHSHEGKIEFQSELSIIAGLRHKNLVQLQGWCVEKGELLLVYDFMPNGSLDKMLYKEPERGKLLSWSHRKNIALGLASVLVYLHQECEQRVIHRDIKAGNILLDGNLNPRLGDFGLAKLMDHDKSPVSTLTAGTMGYLAPEYLQYGKATDKSDVFSYGVVVLEVACGRRPIEREGSNSKMVNLIDFVWGLHSEGRVVEAADKRLNGEFEEEDMRNLLLLGLSCANPHSSERPSMRRVLQILNTEAAPLVVPKVKPTLTFSSHLPLTIEDIVSDAQDLGTSHSMCEIKIHSM
ncbi:probable L-type lectin-domain containing receptor kinase S.7 [Cajanus cajan]|uniref:non-specific serine/threonine protein kinase n=1 Tax=Cajanus cajan TaxID=3821 RepID=A0A151U2E8_CAJCA|nr:probable L-type lectin-domain containing receptor kinase S.7 [Cajanus cajan]KYP73477.1 Lectin-domain containing receptor kinase A4.2 [Cajanus cajan]